MSAVRQWGRDAGVRAKQGARDEDCRELYMKADGPLLRHVGNAVIV